MALSQNTKTARREEGADLGHAHLEYQDGGRDRGEGAHSAPALVSFDAVGTCDKGGADFRDIRGRVHGDLLREQQQAVRDREQDVCAQDPPGAFFGRSKLDAIQPREIESFKSAKLKAGLSPKTVNNHLTILRRILSLAAEWEIISHTPPIKWLKVPDPELDFLDFEEAARLVKGGAGEWATMIGLGLGTGMRQGELLALRWEDVDLIAGRLMVRRAVARGIIGTPKSGKAREIPLNGTVMSALKAHRHLRGELVFCEPEFFRGIQFIRQRRKVE